MSLTIAETTPPRDPGAARAPDNTGDEAPGAEFARLLGQALPQTPPQTLPQTLPAEQGACTPAMAPEAAATTAPASEEAEDTQVLDLLATRLTPAFAPPAAPPTMPGAFIPLPAAHAGAPEPPPASPPPTIAPLTLSAATSLTAGTASAPPLPDPTRAGGARADPAPALLPVGGEPAVDLRTGAALTVAALAAKSAASSVAVPEPADGAQGWLETGPEYVGDQPVGETLPDGRDAGLPLSRTTLATAQPGPEAAEPSLQRHGEDIRDLATRMGETLGRRLIAEIARGNWQLKLKLNPATLGQIEVSMQMRDGELEAFFAASQAMTRELLGEGLGRLRETLSSMGMNIASLDVADGHGSGHGGGSTPRPPAHWQQARAGVGATTPAEPAAVRLPAGSQGLDVIV